MSTIFRTPSNAEWKAFYEAADLLRREAPWEWMYDQLTIAVENPEGGDTAYCCVIGGAGESYGLLAYLGRKGLESHAILLDMANRKPDDLIGMFRETPTMADVLQSYHLLSINLVDDAEIDRAERRRQERLGVKGAPPLCWVDATRFIAGKPSRELSADEARFSVDIITQVVETAKEMRRLGKAFFEDAEPGMLWTLSPVIDPETKKYRWTGAWKRPELSPGTNPPEFVMRDLAPSLEGAALEEYDEWTDLLDCDVTDMRMLLLRSTEPLDMPEDVELFNDAPIIGAIDLDLAVYVGAGSLGKIGSIESGIRGIVSMLIREVGIPAQIHSPDQFVLDSLFPLTEYLGISLYSTHLPRENQEGLLEIIKERLIATARMAAVTGIGGSPDRRGTARGDHPKGKSIREQIARFCDERMAPAYRGHEPC